MFLRRYQRTKQGKTHCYYALVESVRTPAGPRQRVVAHLGELNHDQERRWQRTVVFHNRQGDAQQLRLFLEDEHVALPDDPDVVRVRLDRVAWTNPRRFGDVWLARWLWQLLGLDDIISRHVPQGKETVRPADADVLSSKLALSGIGSEPLVVPRCVSSSSSEERVAASIAMCDWLRSAAGGRRATATPFWLSRI